MPASRAQRAITAERRSKALQMRLAGLQYQQIADALGYADRAAACKDITRALELHQREAAQSTELLRTAEAARLDMLQQAMWPEAMAGAVRPAETVLKIIDQRIRLFGLGQTQKVIDSAVDAWLQHLTGGPTGDTDTDTDDDGDDSDGAELPELEE